jgi:polysaccharide deacetylase 2 family uncharacterized protein YibQ
MADDDLSAPLGRRPRKKKRFVLPVSMPRMIAAALFACVATAAGWALMVDDPLGGEPMVVVSAQGRNPAPTAKGPDAAPAPHTPAVTVTAAQPDKPPASPQTVTIIDGSTGKRQEVVVGGNAASKAAPKAGAGIDARLLEASPHGMIPKIGPDGARAAEVYARPVKPQAGRADGPRIAIVIGGLGIGANTTSEAFAKLPAPVTFAFSPYGTDLERWVSRARGEGHEVLLQVGMEPFDYPDNDPGPQTLLSSATAEQNLDRLHWFMSRFQGYVGISNLMGARFSASEQAFTPVLREIAKRGLIYVDDGTAPRSLAGQMSGASNAAFAKADVVIDATPSSAQIDAALARLEAAAKARGVAVGTAGTLPVTIERIARWAKAAEARGITLVPVSAVANKPKSS